MLTHGLDGLTSWRVDAPKNQVLFDQGDTAEGLYSIETGCVRLQINGEDGARRIIAFLFPGDIFGISLDRRRIVSAEAVTPSRLRRYPATSIHALVSKNPEAAATLIMAVCDLACELSQQLSVAANAPAETRLMRFLQWLSGRQDGEATVTLPMSRRDIADFLSLAPETLSRTFANLEEDGLIEVEERSQIRLVRARKARAVAANGMDEGRALRMA